MNEPKKARAIGVNHVALEVGDIDEALEFYGGFLEFELRSRSDNAVFIDLGDQFINFSRGRRQAPDDDRHFGLVVDDRQLVADALERMGVELLPGPFMDFLDPWGNRIEIIDYTGIQFTKAPYVLKGMGLEGLGKTGEAIAELTEKGMAPD
ncbi:MAG: VOC family protein [Gammaproteobacteria bacterium]|nr:VOC family protein [Gammaproteobacteria bacterium]MCZ6797414.1 VOC family protein [Gammaproteobacteria bacterium]